MVKLAPEWSHSALLGAADWAPIQVVDVGGTTCPSALVPRSLRVGRVAAMDLVAELTGLLGPGRAKAHPLERRLFEKDSGISRGTVAAVVFPETTQEVAACVRIARRHGVPVVARGAGTGLAGGATPIEPAVVVVLTKMNQIHEVDEESRTAWVGPGVINLDLTNHLAPLGYHFALRVVDGVGKYLPFLWCDSPWHCV